MFYIIHILCIIPKYRKMIGIISLCGGNTMILCDLKRVLEDRDMTQKDLAKAVKAHEYTISRLCNNGFKKLDVDLLNSICQHLNIRLSDLLLYKRD